jgi:DNA-binding HxlR family transcriptional regulator
MQRTQFDEMACSVARTLNIIGEWWTLLVLRDIFYGVRRFDILRRHLGISRKVLTGRLKTLVEHQILERILYQEHPPRYEYRLTERGRELFPLLVMLMAWGDKWELAGGAPPVRLEDRVTGEEIQPVLVSAHDGRPIRYRNVRARLGSPEHQESWQRLQQAIAESR